MGRDLTATFDEHQRIIDAIRRRDPPAAAHVELNKVMLIDLLIGTSEIGSINLFRH